MIQDLTPKDAISIVICHASSDSARNLAEYIRRGIEEEQMPARLLESNGTSMELARSACETSLLAVGLGVDQDAVITLTHFQMPTDQPLIQMASGGSAAIARLMGSNAARLYKRMPFILNH